MTWDEVDQNLARIQELEEANEVLRCKVTFGHGQTEQERAFDIVSDWLTDQIKDDPIGDFEVWMEQRTRKELGGLLAWYIAEANHQGWEGYSPSNKTGVRKFLKDLMACYEAVTKDKDKQDYFETDDYFTGTKYLTKDMGPQE